MVVAMRSPTLARVDRPTCEVDATCDQDSSVSTQPVTVLHAVGGGASPCTTSTGHFACSDVAALTDPRSSPANPPWPRLPTTSNRAFVLACTSTCAAPPSCTETRSAGGGFVPNTSWTVRRAAVSASSAGFQSGGTLAMPAPKPMPGYNCQAIVTSRSQSIDLAMKSAHRNATWDCSDASMPTTTRPRVDVVVSSVISISFYSAVASEDDLEGAGLVGASKDVVGLDEVIETEAVGHETLSVDLMGCDELEQG